jgi:hypothetical protein
VLINRRVMVSLRSFPSGAPVSHPESCAGNAVAPKAPSEIFSYIVAFIRMYNWSPKVGNEIPPDERSHELNNGYDLPVDERFIATPPSRAG